MATKTKRKTLSTYSYLQPSPIMKSLRGDFIHQTQEYHLCYWSAVLKPQRGQKSSCCLEVRKRSFLQLIIYLWHWITKKRETGLVVVVGTRSSNTMFGYLYFSYMSMHIITFSKWIWYTKLGLWACFLVGFSICEQFLASCVWSFLL